MTPWDADTRCTSWAKVSRPWRAPHTVGAVRTEPLASVMDSV